MTNQNHPKKILQLDRDMTFLFVAKEILLTLGNFEIDVATTISEAKKKLESKQYNVIVSGYHFPDGNGLGFLAELKAKGNKTPFIMLSVHNEIAKKATELGAVKFFNKNKECEIVYGELSKTIKDIL
jgi:DNA-binding NtrC family response regulator